MDFSTLSEFADETALPIEHLFSVKGELFKSMVIIVFFNQ